MKTILKICILGAALAGCTQGSGNLPVRTTPQAQHPSQWARAQSHATPSYTAASAVTVAPVEQADTCGASRYQSLVGGPSRATSGLNIPSSSRHYGSDEIVATNTPSRLNFVHSGTAVESVIDPMSKVIRVFCG
ncbi:hypothetical protein [Pacificibacter marinus]|uniref:hypothetical protein n=1 Tax=Pacificibacter marinus TaxID=658057 RepID=UPI001C06C8BC|nr:hypothetical protein [Pacificibacter marinus]MBU2868205.1 hypothetical protein [Pacificibacter marinus]